MTDVEPDDPPPHESGQRPPSEMRLRSARPPVTRLSRKVLIGLGAIAALGIGGALFLALEPQRKPVGSKITRLSTLTPPR
jgi:type IV secretion system protein VirB10